MNISSILTTIDPRQATCCINATADTRKEVVEILTHLDTEVKSWRTEKKRKLGIEVNISFRYDKINVRNKGQEESHGSGMSDEGVKRS